MTDVYYTYLLCCWKDKESFDQYRPLYGHIIYTGYTSNIFQRLVQHIKGQSNYTKQFKGNIRFGWLEMFETRTEALHKEAELKNKLEKWFGIKQEKCYTRDDKVAMIYNFKLSRPDVLDFINKSVEKLLEKC